MFVYLSLSIIFFLLSFCFKTIFFIILSSFFSGQFWVLFWFMFKNQNLKMPPLPIIHPNSDSLTSASERKYDDCEREEKK